MALACQAFSHCRCCLYSALHSSAPSPSGNAEPSIPKLKILPDAHVAPYCHFQHPVPKPPHSPRYVWRGGDGAWEPRAWANIFVILLITCVNGHRAYQSLSRPGKQSTEQLIPPRGWRGRGEGYRTPDLSNKPWSWLISLFIKNGLRHLFLLDSSISIHTSSVCLYLFFFIPEWPR